MAEDHLPNSETEAGNALAPAAGDAASERRRSRQAGDLPPAIGGRYFSEETGLRREWRLFENARDPAPAIRDLGHRLIQAGESQAVVRDMVEIAAHRRWDRIRVTGSGSFRRIVTEAAHARGIEVDGVRAPEPANHQAASDDRPASPVPAKRSADFRDGVRGTVIEIGSAVYQDRPGRRPSPFVDLRVDDGNVRRAWGAGLPAAIARGGIELGDVVELRQTSDGAATGRKAARTWSAERLERSDRSKEPAPAVTSAEPARHEPLGERFRRLDDKGRSGDPELQAAQSQLIAAKALAAAYFMHDPATAALLGARLQASIATALDKGRSFGPARTRRAPDGRHELVLDRDRGKDAGAPSAQPKGERHPEITKDRDRGRRR